MTHTPFVSNPCPATAIVFISQNLFYGQLPQGCSFFCALSSARRFCSPKGLLFYFSRTVRECALRGIFSFHGKRISPFDPQEKGIRIVSEQLEELQCLPIALPIARRSRVGLCYTTWLAPTIRCRSACLVVVQPNFRLPRHPSMRRAQQSRISQAVCRQANVTRASR